MDKTISVLIADDEQVVRNGLRFLINQIPGFNVVAEASNGREAVSKADQLEPDVLILDVKMAPMNGLEALEMIKSQLPDSRTIILSGHDDFSYAQRALRYGADDYLLKPANLSKLRKVLFAMQRMIEERDNDKQEREKIHEKLEHSNFAFLESFYRDLLFGELSDDDIIQKREFIGFTEERIAVLIASVDNLFKIQANEERENIKKLTRSIRQSLHNILKRKSQLLSPVIQIDNCLVFFYFENLKPSAREFAQYCIHTISLEYRRSVSISIGDFYSFNALQSSFSQAKQRLKKRLVLGSAQIIDSDDLFETEGFRFPFALQTEIQTALRSLDKQKLDAAIKKLFGYLRTSRITPEAWYRILHDILEECLHMVNNYLVKSCETNIQINTYRELLDLTSADDMQFWMEKNSDMLLSSMQDNSKCASAAVRKALTYISQNYMRPLSLSDVASEVKLNPNYLSNLFKQETGKTFLEHLTSYRIKEAKRLLKDDDMNVSEVAYALGYDNPRYFSEVFRKTENMSPSEYKKGIITRPEN